MRVFKVKDGSSWLARPEDAPAGDARPRCGWESILFEQQPAGTARLVYRPAGWLAAATEAELAAALAEGESIRARWGTPQG